LTFHTALLDMGLWSFQHHSKECAPSATGAAAGEGGWMRNGASGRRGAVARILDRDGMHLPARRRGRRSRGPPARRPSLPRPSSRRRP
jgi:hypothetical protein